jgi:1,4-alpha-glucan branching enzyme
MSHTPSKIRRGEQVEQYSVTARWRFQLHCPQADRVYLVVDPADAPSTWLEMQRDAKQGLWRIELSLTASGPCRFRYYVGQGSTVVNGGNHGLVAEMIEQPHLSRAGERTLALSA